MVSWSFSRVFMALFTSARGETQHKAPSGPINTKDRRHPSSRSVQQIHLTSQREPTKSSAWRCQKTRRKDQRRKGTKLERLLLNVLPKGTESDVEVEELDPENAQRKQRICGDFPVHTS